MNEYKCMRLTIGTFPGIIVKFSLDVLMCVACSLLLPGTLVPGTKYCSSWSAAGAPGQQKNGGRVVYQQLC